VNPAASTAPAPREPLRQAKRRAARRRREDGAAMFVVAMMVAVLASLGVFALAAAATEVRMSGNERQNTQTHYLAEYGILAGVRDLRPTTIDSEVKMMAQYADTCLALASVPKTAPPTSLMCRRKGSQTYAQQYNAGPNAIDAYNQAPYSPGVAPGSLGAVPMKGDFFVEETDVSDAEPKMSSGNRCTKIIALTSYGMTQAAYPGMAANETAVYGSEGIEIQRAYVEVPGTCGQARK
jgi:hypothetical protein